MKQPLFYILLFPALLLPQIVKAQSQDISLGKKGSFYFYWGYNRGFYSKTNLHFTGPNYDFTLYDIRATDRPTPLSWEYFNPVTLTVPQYNTRIGFFLTDRFAVSFGTDHMKYVATPGQETTISGVISETASTKYAGYYLNEPIRMDPDLLKFEHTDGFNVVTLDVEYLQPVRLNLGKRLALGWNVGIGGVWVVTKTNVRVMGDGLDNDFHVSGYTLAGKMGPRLEYNRRFFLLAEIKGGYASLPGVFIKNDAPELGDHNLTFIEYYAGAGVNFRLFGNKAAF